MKPGSITVKLLALIIGAFIFSTVSVLLLANAELKQIIDKSQKVVYSEKIEAILGILSRDNQRLQKTGMIEAYSKDFKESALQDLRRSYYTHPNRHIYPFIIDTEGNVVMRPNLPSEYTANEQARVFKKMLSTEQGSFTSDLSHGQRQWYIFKQFPAWHWVIGYTVPLELKYADVRKFRNLLIGIMGSISVVVLLILSILVARFTEPITRLTIAAKAIAKGRLDQPVDNTDNRDELGALARSFASMRDAVRQKITELQEENTVRCQAEEDLAQQNKYIRSILESLTHPFYAIDINDYSIKIANSASGLKAGGPSTCYALTHHRDSPCDGISHPCPLNIIKQTKKPAMVEHIHCDPEGGRRHIEIHAYPVFDRRGELIQMIEYSIDISERRRAQIELAAEKERLSVTLRSIGDGVITTDIAGNIVLLNKVAETLTGWSAREATGRPLKEIFHIINSQTGKICENPATRVLSSGHIIDLANHTVLIARDGRRRDIADSGAPIRNSQSEIIGVVLVFRDVTDQLKSARELMKVKKLESIGILAGGIAHDFNNILTAILGNLNLAVLDPKLEEKTRNLLSAAEKASLRAKDLTQQLLTFAKGGEPVKATSSLKNVIRDSANFVLHGDKVACRYKIPADLWLVDIDTGQISQVIQNIVLNASHAMPEGGRITITGENLPSISTEGLPFMPEGRFIKISIQDNGIGMPSNVLDKIFDPYFTTKHKGNGLGLAITQSIIKKHNGHITTSSTPGAGTTFTIYLPASEHLKTAKQETPGATVSSRARILIMDDNEMVQNLIKTMLVHMGHEVVLSTNGEEAIKLYQESLNTASPFDLIIMDLTIPGGMGGKDAVLEIHKINPEARVIVSSGYSNDPIMANCTEYGFCAALTKPYQLQQLSQVISRCTAAADSKRQYS